MMTDGKRAQGRIREVLPNDLYQVELETGSLVTVSLGGQARQATVRLIPGQRVEVEISSRAPSRGKIKRRLS